MPERTLIARRLMPFAPPDPADWRDEPDLYDDDFQEFEDDFEGFDESDGFEEFESARVPGGWRRAWLLAAGTAAIAALAASGFLVLRGGSGQGKVNAAVAGAPAATRTPAGGISGPPPVLAPAAVPAPTTALTVAPVTTAPAPAPTTPPPTLPDGSWPTVTVTFDTNQVTLTGAVPSAAAANRLRTVAAANSKTKAPVKDQTTVDPRVPANVGVRVVELTSTRFPTGSSTIMPAHALELDRVVNMLKAAPNLTLVVIGHADQRGTSADNLTLSGARAQAVVDYLVSRGIDAARLGSKAVGSEDPLTQASTQAGLALNRRTEFVFYGLLVGA
jgi:outer membrane protein OmpA-like peptidoglycan-associated protein